MDPELYIEDLKSKFAKINFDEYFLSYSGGKDSHLLYWFIKEILKDDKIKIVAVNTQLEHPEIRDRMIKYADIVLLPSKKHQWIKDTYGSPCFSKQQDEYIMRYQNGSRTKSTMMAVNRDGRKYVLNKTAQRLLLSGKLHRVSNLCCKYIKKIPMDQYAKTNNKKPIIGVRAKEGIMRSQYKSCFTKDKKFMPLWDLDDETMNAIYKKYNIEVPKIYDVVHRTGCFGCPYGRNIQRELATLNPAQRRFIEKYFKESYEAKGIITNQKELEEYE